MLFKKIFFFIGDFPEPEPKKCNYFGSGTGQKGGLRATPAPAPQHWYSLMTFLCYIFYYFQRTGDLSLVVWTP